MTSKNTKNLRVKTAAPVSLAAAAETSAPRASTGVVVDFRTARKIAAKPSLSPAAEGLRFMQAFLQIPDPIKRAELIKMTEDYVRRAR